MNDFEVVIKDQDQSKEVKVLIAHDGLKLDDSQDHCADGLSRKRIRG